MRFKFLTFSLMIVFTAFSFGTCVQTANEPHKETNIFELFEREEDDDDKE